MFLGARVTRAISLLVLSVVLLLTLPAPIQAAHQDTPMEDVETPIAFESFERGFMLWRRDTGQITVGFTAIRTKTGAVCQEVYQDTYRGQAYDLPPAEPGFSVPSLGFGWLYVNDREMAARLGRATRDEVSLVARIRPLTIEGVQVLELALSENLPGVANPLTIAYSDEPGLTYCFARRTENRAELNTWMAVQAFEYGFMVWRQDRPDRVEVIHQDTDWAPELMCLDRFLDTWRPGEELIYGDLALPGRHLPERGFGKVWMTHAYVRESLGYPLDLETGGFAEIVFEPFSHPRRGQLVVRRSVTHLPSGQDFRLRTTMAGSIELERENRLAQGCGGILIPHQPR